jgi:hypothetical protein
MATIVKLPSGGYINLDLLWHAFEGDGRLMIDSTEECIWQERGTEEDKADAIALLAALDAEDAKRRNPLIHVPFAPGTYLTEHPCPMPAYEQRPIPQGPASPTPQGTSPDCGGPVRNVWDKDGNLDVGGEVDLPGVKAFSKEFREEMDAQMREVMEAKNRDAEERFCEDCAFADTPANRVPCRDCSRNERRKNLWEPRGGEVAP